MSRVRRDVSHTSECATCRRANQCFLSQYLPAERSDCAGIVQRRQPVACGEVLYYREQTMNSVFLVCSGSVKTQRTTHDGDLVINGFYLPGDLVGIDAIPDGQHSADAIATTHSEVCSLDCSRLVSECGHHPAISQWLLARIGEYTRRKDNDLAWSAGLHTRHRVLRFFVQLHERMTKIGGNTYGSTRLPMQKQDIARYLHMTPESLSRNLSSLRRDGLLELHNGSFALPDIHQARVVTQL